MAENRMQTPTFLRRLLLSGALAATLLLGAARCTWTEIPAESGSVLFQDDFARASSGWDRYQDSLYSSDYIDGVFRISIAAPDTNAWATPGLDIGDVRIEVEATKVSGPDDNVFGILCRYQDSQNFYFFLISSDGFAGVGVRRAGETTLLSGLAMTPSEAVLQGSARNHLRADCFGDQLDLYVNGQAVAHAVASDWLRGDVGLIAGTYAEPGVVIDFDNFSALQP
jgi:hypothetical protein